MIIAGNKISKPESNTIFLENLSTINKFDMRAPKKLRPPYSKIGAI